MTVQLRDAAEAAGPELVYRVSNLLCDAGQWSLRPGERSPAFVWAALARALNVPADDVLPSLVSAVHRTEAADLVAVAAALVRMGDLVPQPIINGVLSYDTCVLPGALAAELEAARAAAAREIEEGAVDCDTVPEGWS